MRLDYNAINPDSIGSKIGRTLAQNRQGRRSTLGSGVYLGESLWDTFTGALTSTVKTGVEVGKSLLPQAILQVTGATDQIKSLLSQVSAYREAVYARVLSLDSVMSRQIPPMTMSADPNIRQTGLNLRERASALRTKGATYYALLAKNEQDLYAILNNVAINADYLTTSLATIQRIVGEGGSLSIQGKDFTVSFNDFMSEFQSEYNRVYQTSTGSVIQTAVAAIPEDISKAVTAAGAAIKSAQPWLIPGLIIGLIALIGLRSRR